MSKKTSSAKLRTLIRKIVQEELNKALKSNDPGSSDNFDLDPRFSTGHYMTDHDPFPHLEPSGEAKRQTGKHSGKKTPEQQTPPFSSYPGGIFGPPPPPLTGPQPSPPSGRSTAQRNEAFPPHPGFGMHPPQTGKRNEQNND